MKNIFSFLFFLLMTSGFSAQAHMVMGESGEVVPIGKYQFGGQFQALTNEGGGLNVAGFFDVPFDDSTSGRVSLGFGAVDFSVLASVKFVPFPDVDQQPAIGVRLGAGFSRDGSDNMGYLQAAPLVSKKVYHEEAGTFIPYLAIPFNLVNAKSENYLGTQFAVGSEWLLPDRMDFKCGAEIVLNLNKSYSSILAYITLPFDAIQGLKRR